MCSFVRVKGEEEINMTKCSFFFCLKDLFLIPKKFIQLCSTVSIKDNFLKTANLNK